MPKVAKTTRRQLTLLIAVAGIAAAVLAAALIPVPYVVLFPGPTLNTLGAQPGGKDLIQITGHHTYPPNGHLNLVTVAYRGGPADSLNLFSALQGWLTPHEAVVPQEELFGANQTQQQVTRQDTQQMVGSQQLAQAAALCQLGIKFQTVDTIDFVQAGLPAAGVLHKGDVVTAVDGNPVTCKTPVGALIKAHPPGTTVVLTVDRKGVTHNFRLKTANAGGKAVVGIRVLETYRFPFQVKISVGDIGGPSAGLMFALGIIDKLTPGSLTDGRFVAGTGEIAANGAVSPIGGIQQKMAGARAAGATIFLTPAANCPDTAAAVPQGLRLVKVSTLSGAMHDLSALAAGRSVPSC